MPTARPRARRLARSTRGAACRREAEAEFQAALRLSPGYPPAAVNLADHYRRSGAEDEAEQVLRTAIAVMPRQASLHHALGLALARSQRYDQALDELRQASRDRAGQCPVRLCLRGRALLDRRRAAGDRPAEAERRPAPLRWRHARRAGQLHPRGRRPCRRARLCRAVAEDHARRPAGAGAGRRAEAEQPIEQVPIARD